MQRKTATSNPHNVSEEAETKIINYHCKGSTRPYEKKNI